MKVIKNLHLEIPGTNTHSFNIDEFSQEDSIDCLFYGYIFLESIKDLSPYQRGGRNVYLNVTMPTEFCSIQKTDADQHFDEVWSICPYSVKWINEINKSDKYHTIFYPFNKNDIPKGNIKKYDVIYHGGIHGHKYIEMLRTITKFNYRYLTQTIGINSETYQMINYATNVNLSNQEKLDIISQTKISICFNTFEVRDFNDLQNIKQRDGWESNEAWKHIDDLRIIPQFKSRCNEAAFCKTLNLVQRDPWNVIEKYYASDEFVYFDSVEELPRKINEILNNWDQYEDMIERAFQRSLNYTTEKLFQNIKNKIYSYEL
jgi:hypothetical protein